MSAFAFLAVIFAIWRTVDGQWKVVLEARHPIRVSWTLLGGLLIAVVCLGQVEPWGLAAAYTLPFLIIYNRGYEDWNDWVEMALRAGPVAFLPLIESAWSLWRAEADFGPWTSAAAAIVIAVNIVQPWLRRRAHAAVVEAIEGAGLGLALACL